MLVSSIVAFVILKKITIGSSSDDDVEEAEAKPVIENEDSDEDSFSPENYILLRKAGELENEFLDFITILNVFFFLQLYCVHWQHF